MAEFPTKRKEEDEPSTPWSLARPGQDTRLRHVMCAPISATAMLDDVQMENLVGRLQALVSSLHDIRKEEDRNV